jgi:hypothetical protein
MAKDFKGTVRTAEEFIAILQSVPPEAGVRIATDELTFSPEVYFCHYDDSDLCYILMEHDDQL